MSIVETRRTDKATGNVRDSTDKDLN